MDELKQLSTEQLERVFDALTELCEVLNEDDLSITELYQANKELALKYELDRIYVFSELQRKNTSNH